MFKIISHYPSMESDIPDLLLSIILSEVRWNNSKYQLLNLLRLFGKPSVARKFPLLHSYFEIRNGIRPFGFVSQDYWEAHRPKNAAHNS